MRLINRGINGGGILAVRDGTDTGAYVSPQNQNGNQAGFAEVLKHDRATIAVMIIGINDVWWRDTAPETYAAALRDIAAAAKQQGTQLILVTLTGIGEKPDGTNPYDTACDQFAELVREVARECEVPLVDLRRVFRAYQQNHNARLRLDGRVVPRSEFLLTYDGVHLTAVGNELVANHLASAIVAVLRQ
jgi:lysophospholipase L1-like esterase